MARSTFVKSARASKGERDCLTCLQPIEPGQSYWWNQPNRYSQRFNWHATCKAPAPSVLEGNEKRATAMAAFENAYEAVEGLSSLAFKDDPESLLDDLRQIASEVSDGVNEAAEMWQESASNIEDGFGHSTSTSEEMEEHAGTYESVASDVEDAAADLEEFEPENEETFEEWFDRIIEEFTSALADVEGNLD